MAARPAAGRRAVEVLLETELPGAEGRRLVLVDATYEGGDTDTEFTVRIDGRNRRVRITDQDSPWASPRPGSATGPRRIRTAAASSSSPERSPPTSSAGTCAPTRYAGGSSPLTPQTSSSSSSAPPTSTPA